MTTTQLFSGLQDKNSSRVLQPPGGGSSNIFGSDATPPTQKPAQKHPKDSGIFGSAADSSSTKATVNTGNAQTVVESGDSAKTTPTAQKSAGTYNPITGESIGDKQTPSTRVRQPPGGASSKLW